MHNYKYFIFFFLLKISKMSINRSGETTVELATPSRKSFVFLHEFKRFRQFYVFTGRSLALVQMHIKMIRLIAK